MPQRNRACLLASLHFAVQIRFLPHASVCKHALLCQGLRVIWDPKAKTKIKSVFVLSDDKRMCSACDDNQCKYRPGTTNQRGKAECNIAMAGASRCAWGDGVNACQCADSMRNPTAAPTMFAPTSSNPDTETGAETGALGTCADDQCKYRPGTKNQRGKKECNTALAGACAWDDGVNACQCSRMFNSTGPSTPANRRRNVTSAGIHSPTGHPSSSRGK